MTAYITRTGAFLPGEPIDNASMSDFMGTLWGEPKVRRQILKANGIERRHYALDRRQRPTHDVYQLAARAVEHCLEGDGDEEGRNKEPITYLSAGSTHTPFNGPGLSSQLHAELAGRGGLGHPLEINSNAGICTSGAQAIVNADRAIRSGDHRRALAVGVEQCSVVLKSKAIRPTYDLRQMLRDLRRSRWFMSVFLRSMLSDGAGAFLIEGRPSPSRVSFEIEWTHSRSFAHQTPLCMKLDNRDQLLSQDIQVLTQFMGPCVREVVAEAMTQYDDHLGRFKTILPHLSSFFFRRHVFQVFRALGGGREQPLEYWTNLATRGNTGSASIYILLDEYIRTHELANGDRLLLFIPESGRFNFVLVSLKAVC